MNRFFTLLLAASCLTAVGQVPDYVPTDGLVGWYALDGDVSQFSFNTSQGGSSGINPTQNRFSQHQKAVAIGGGDFCLFNDVGSLDAIGEWTFSIWIRPSSGIEEIDYPHIWRFYGPDSYASILMHLMGPAYEDALEGQIELYMTNAEGTQNPDDPHLWEATPSLDVWSHVVARRENGEISVFLNSVLTASHESSDYGLDSLILTGLSLGGNADYPAAANRHWLGGLDDAGVWGRALSEAEIFSLYNAPGPLEGCSDEVACNYDLEVVVDDGSCFYADDCGECDGDGTSGCIDDYACNYDITAQCDDGSCDYSCCPGPGCCLDGQHWDWDLNGCVITNPSDSNFDGCVQLNDLLDLLSAYGDCGAEESAWQCGDPLEYQGYDYETVQIGEQCWFAENLRAENYRNGESIVYSGSASDWETNGYTAQGCRAAYNDDPMLGALWGYIYNGFAVNDERALCPTGWIVPKNADWLELGEFLGGMNVAGQKMKNSPNDEFAWNGDNSSGFGGYATGDRHWPDGSFNHALDGSVGDSEVVVGLYWSGAPGSIPAQNYYALYEMDDELTQSSSNGPPLGFGAAVRCIKD